MERVQEEMRWVVVVDELSREGKLQIQPYELSEELVNHLLRA